MSKPGLFKDFDEVSAKAWKQKIQFDLKGADYNDTLVWESPDGIKVRPFYNADDLKNGRAVSPVSNAQWNIGQIIYAGNAALANAKALDILQKGVKSLIFTIPSDEIQIERLLNGIDLETTPIYFDFQFLSASYIKDVLKFVGGPKSKIHLNIDIIGNLARTGNWFFNLKEDHEILGDILTASQSDAGPDVLAVDVSLYQNAGANMVQQLAYAMAHANEYLNHFNLHSSRSLTFKVSVGSNYFFEIAKLRALRLLWNTLASEYDLKTDCHIVAMPGKRNKTLYDYNSNMLRTTTESMAAVLGGADTVYNLPYDAIYHKDNKFGERIARNQLLILQHESYFDKVANPADGCYYIETLTRQMAENALELFKGIEKSGGFLKQLKDHTLQKKIKESAQKEQERFNTMEEVLVGTNKYLVADDSMKDNMELYPFVKTNTRKTLLEPILERRLAEESEQKRLKDEQGN